MTVAPVSAGPIVPIVIDTNIVLDLFVFADADAMSLRQALAAGTLGWIATPPMREELARVLDYPQIVPRLAFYRLSAADVLAQFDHHVRVEAVAPKANAVCKDADDQKFIDLAVAHQAHLLSKDRAVLCMRKRLLPWGVQVSPSLNGDGAV